MRLNLSEALLFAGECSRSSELESVFDTWAFDLEPLTLRERPYHGG